MCGGAGCANFSMYWILPGYAARRRRYRSFACVWIVRPFSQRFKDASPNPVTWANFARVIPNSFLICRISSGDRTPRCRHIAPCFNRSASSSRYSKSQASHRRTGTSTVSSTMASPVPYLYTSGFHDVVIPVLPHSGQVSFCSTVCSLVVD